MDRPMDWQEAIKQEQAALKRIAALLFALAHLAELSAARSAAVRGFVLWLLGRAEVYALDLAGLAPFPPFAGGAGSTPAHARRLAARLRKLARAVQREVRMVAAFLKSGGEALPPVRQPRLPSQTATLIPALQALLALRSAPFPDTS